MVKCCTPGNGLVFVILLGKESVFHDFYSGERVLFFMKVTPAIERVRAFGPSIPVHFRAEWGGSNNHIVSKTPAYSQLKQTVPLLEKIRIFQTTPPPENRKVTPPPPPHKGRPKYQTRQTTRKYLPRCLVLIEKQFLVHLYKASSLQSSVDIFQFTMQPASWNIHLPACVYLSLSDGASSCLSNLSLLVYSFHNPWRLCFYVSHMVGHMQLRINDR